MTQNMAPIFSDSPRVILLVSEEKMHTGGNSAPRVLIGCYNIFWPIFYLQDNSRKQTEQLLLLCSHLGNWCYSLYYTVQTRSRSNTKFLTNMQKSYGASYERKPTRTIFCQCAQKSFFNEIFKACVRYFLSNFYFFTK